MEGLGVKLQKSGKVDKYLPVFAKSWGIFVTEGALGELFLFIYSLRGKGHIF